MADTVIVKLTRAVVLDGQIQRAGTKLELAEDEAKSFLRMGKAELVSQPQASAKTDAAAAAQAAAAAAATKPAAAASAPTPAAPAAPAVAAAPAGR